jgi:hypothetical protein
MAAPVDGIASSRQIMQHVDKPKVMHAVDRPAGLDRLARLDPGF